MKQGILWRLGWVLVLAGLAACGTGASPAAPVAETVTPAASPSPSPIPTAMPTPTPSPTPPALPTPVPTVSLGFLVDGGTVTPTATLPLLAIPTPYPDPKALPSRVIPEPFGVNIHFTRPDPGEMNLMAAGGFRFVRMDLFWHLIERERGRYDFSEYDALVSTMEAHGMRIVFILDYGNDLYGGGGAAHYSEEGQAAFARFAATAARRYRTHGIIWEIWNEPNLDKFWHAPPDPVEYAKLAATVVQAIRRVDPTAWIVGPATAGFPWDYIAALADQGVLNRLDAVTVHPYRFDKPESAWEDYVRLRGILDRASPDRKIPIISGEWGYATVAAGPTEEQQAQYLTRQWLFHLASDVDLSIWYDWRNDGADPQDMEHNFGIVTEDLAPKAAYHAARTLISTLDGYSFRRRIPLESAADYLLLFRRDGVAALAAWTSGDPHVVTLPVRCDAVDLVEMSGETHTIAITDGQLPLTFENGPRYVHLCPTETHARVALWGPAEAIQLLDADGAGRVLIDVDNPFHETLQGEIEVWSGGQRVGTSWVQARPGQISKISVPVAVAAAPGQVVPATVVFITPDSLPLQTGAVWLHVIR